MSEFNATIIEITATVDSSLEDRSNPYFERTLLTPRLTSTTKFDRVVYRHLGFQAWSRKKEQIRHIGDLYRYVGYLEPNFESLLVIPPFKLCLENLGDGFMGVHIRLRQGMEQCKISILQEQYQPKSPRTIDDFIEYEGIWYATATVNCLQTLKIEEITQEKGDS